MRHAHGVIAAAAVAVLFFMPRAALGADSWVDVKSAHFTVISNAGERAGRSVAFDWEQLRIAIHAAWPWARVDLDRPLVVFAVNAEDDMKAFAPQYWEQRGAVRPDAIATGGVDQHSFLIRADLSKDDRNRTTNPYYSSYWTYVVTVLDASVRRPLPLWVESGLAGIMANSIVGGQTLQIGRMMQAYVSTLHNREHPTIPDLVKIDRNSPWYQRADSREPFDSMAWAFTHFLLFGDEGAHRQKFQMFIDLLVQGKPQDEALAASFGDVSGLTGAFAAYINRQTWPFSQINADMSVPPSSFAVRTMSAADAAAARARFLLEMNRPGDVRTALDAAEKADPKCAAAYDVEGLLAEGNGALTTRSTHTRARWIWGRPTSTASTAGRRQICLPRRGTRIFGRA